LTSEEASLEDIDVSGLGVEQRQYALIYPASIMPRETVYSVYLEARKRAIQAGVAFLRHVMPRSLVVRTAKARGPGPSRARLEVQRKEGGQRAAEDRYPGRQGDSCLRVLQPEPSAEGPTA